MGGGGVIPFDFIVFHFLLVLIRKELWGEMMGFEPPSLKLS